MPQTKPTKRQLLALRKKLTRKEIASKFGVSLSCVKGWIAAYKHGEPTKKQIRVRKKKIPTLEQGYTLIEIAQAVLGNRLKEDWRGFILDGRHCSTDAVLQAANLKYRS